MKLKQCVACGCDAIDPVLYLTKRDSLWVVECGGCCLAVVHIVKGRALRGWNDLGKRLQRKDDVANDGDNG